MQGGLDKLLTALDVLVDTEIHFQYMVPEIDACQEELTELDFFALPDVSCFLLVSAFVLQALLLQNFCLRLPQEVGHTP